MPFADLDDFTKYHNTENGHACKPTWDAEKNLEGHWCQFSYEELVSRDKTSLDVLRLKDKNLSDLDNLTDPDELAEKNVENLESSLASFREVITGLQEGV